MKKLTVFSLFASCMLVIGSAFAKIEKQKVLDERTEIVGGADQTPTIDGGHSAFVPVGVVEDFFVEGRPVTASSSILAEEASYQNVILDIEPAANSPPIGNNPILHRDPGLH